MSLVYDGGVRDGPDLAQSLRRADVDVAGEDLRPVPAKGHHRARLGRRHRHLRSGETTTLSAKTLHMKVDYNPYEGREVTGVTETVLSRAAGWSSTRARFTGGGRAADPFLKRSTVPMTGDEIMTAKNHCTVQEAHDLRVGRRREPSIRFRWRARRACISGRRKASATSTSTAS